MDVNDTCIVRFILFYSDWLQIDSLTREQYFVSNSTIEALLYNSSKLIRMYYTDPAWLFLTNERKFVD